MSCGRPDTTTVAVASSVSSPRSSPASSCSRTLSSISRCALTPSFLRNFRTDMLKASSSTLALRTGWFPLSRPNGSMRPKHAPPAPSGGPEAHSHEPTSWCSPLGGKRRLLLLLERDLGLFPGHLQLAQ